MTNKSVMTFISVNKISVCLSVCLPSVLSASFELLSVAAQQTQQNICITFIQCWPKVELYTIYTTSAQRLRRWANIV